MALACATNLVSAAPSHRPMRPLATATARVADQGKAIYVDPAAAKDGDGSRARPLRDVSAAASRLTPGDTLYLAGGIYTQPISIGVKGTAKAPITIRSAPNELAIFDAGFSEFRTDHARAWEPVAGSAGEYRSVKTYPSLNKLVAGFFVDSMVPLHPYIFVEDLRSKNELWNVPGNSVPGNGVYVGPGIWIDPGSKRLHARFAATTVAKQDNYKGPSDPRTLALSIGDETTPFVIDRAEHVRVQDIVVRGHAGSGIDVRGSRSIELDHVTVYGGSPGLRVQNVTNLRVTRSSFRGTAAPWSSRASMKYRGRPSFLVVFDGTPPQTIDVEISYSEFTDSHDGFLMASAAGMRFHHNLVDNLNDDGLLLSERGRRTPSKDVQIYQNVFSRILTTLAFAQEPTDAVGTGVFVYRNVFDLREPTYNTPPPTQRVPPTFAFSNLCGDHGSPTWEPLYFYQNTVLVPTSPYRDYYGALLTMSTGKTPRRIFNNVFHHTNNRPGLRLPPSKDDVQVDGNLMWSAGLNTDASIVSAFRQRTASPGRGQNDRYADPQFVDLARSDIRPRPSSPMVDAGVALPKSWPDVRIVDQKRPDIGALPLGAGMFGAGPSHGPAIPTR